MGPYPWGHTVATYHPRLHRLHHRGGASDGTARKNGSQPLLWPPLMQSVRAVHLGPTTHYRGPQRHRHRSRLPCNNPGGLQTLLWSTARLARGASQVSTALHWLHAGGPLSRPNHTGVSAAGCGGQNPLHRRTPPAHSRQNGAGFPLARSRTRPSTHCQFRPPTPSPAV